LIQIDVSVGLAINVPRAALIGFRNARSDLTEMRKPPIAWELLMKTPTLSVEPAENGPIVGALLGQFVAVVEDVRQTSPVPVNPAARAEGTLVVGTNRKAVRTRGIKRIKCFFK
jgi:hypothetical protein